MIVVACIFLLDSYAHAPMRQWIFVAQAHTPTKKTKTKKALKLIEWCVSLHVCMRNIFGCFFAGQAHGL